MALTPAYPSHVHSSPATFLAAQPSRFTHLVTSGAMIYSPKHHSTDGPHVARPQDHSKGHDNHEHETEHPSLPTSTQKGPYLLLLQRAATDTCPLHWELPGGMADSTDPSLLNAVTREVGEATGLSVTKIKGHVLPAEVFSTGWGRRTKRWLKVTFLVAAEMLASQSKKRSIAGNITVNTQDGSTSDQDEGGGVALVKENVKETDIADANTQTVTILDEEAEKEVDEAAQRILSISSARITELTDGTAAPPAVHLDPSEHQAHLWVTEEEVRDRKVMDVEMLFISDEQVSTLLGAFGLWREVHETEKK